MLRYAEITSRYIPCSSMGVFTMYYIYGHFDSSGKCHYIGKGSGGRAYDFHRRNLGWKGIFSKANPPLVSILETDIKVDLEAYKIERQYIEKYEKEGHVLQGKGEPTRHWLGKKRPEIGSKISAAKKGKPGPWAGKKRGPHTEEWKANISKNHRRHQTEATKKKISEVKKGRPNGLLGKKRSEETKKKLSEVRKKAWASGMYDRPHHGNKPVRCIELDKVFISAAEASRQLGCMRSKISSCCLGTRKSHYGYTWEYAI